MRIRSVDSSSEGSLGEMPVQPEANLVRGVGSCNNRRAFFFSLLILGADTEF